MFANVGQGTVTINCHEAINLQDMLFPALSSCPLSHALRQFFGVPYIPLDIAPALINPAIGMWEQQIMARERRKIVLPKVSPCQALLHKAVLGIIHRCCSYGDPSSRMLIVLVLQLS